MEHFPFWCTRSCTARRERVSIYLRWTRICSICTKPRDISDCELATGFRDLIFNRDRVLPSLYLPRKWFALGRIFTTHRTSIELCLPSQPVSLKWICECKTNHDSIPFSSGWVAKMCPSANHYQRSWSDDRARSLLNMRCLHPVTSSQSLLSRGFVQMRQYQ